MNFDFSEDQLALQHECRKVLADLGGIGAARKALEGAGFDRAMWDTLGRLGFLGAAIPEEWGGTGAGYLELCVIAEELGRVLAPTPFLSSICLVAELILAHGSAAQKARYLPRLACGELIGCLAVVEGPGALTPRGIAASVAKGSLRGAKTAVLDGDIAHLAVVAALGTAEGSPIGLYLVELDGAGVRRAQLPGLDPSRGHAALVFEGAAAELLAPDGWTALWSALDRAAVLAGFEQVGGAESALEMARLYALERYAFGRPIGSFQAIKHKLVDMYTSVVMARSNCYYGAWALEAGSPQLPEAAAAARVSATQAFQQCAKENIQVHGGMGFTWDLDCHLYYRRSNLLAVALGGATQWQDRLIDQVRISRATAARSST